MITRLAATFTLALALAACNDLPTSENQQDSARNFDRSAPAVAFAGRCDTSFNPQEFEQTENGLRIIVRGTCNLTHLGVTAVYADQIANFQAGTLNGTAILTAANGDQLYTSYSGPLAAPVGALQTIDVVSTFIGGTGRFTAATGTAENKIIANLATGTGELSYDGSISY